VEKSYAEKERGSMRGGRDMTSMTSMRFAGAIAGAAFLVGVVAPSANAQENLGSTVIVGGGGPSIDVDDIAVLAPGVTISGGDVTNETGIGVIIGGGSSIGAVTGGDTNDSIVE
jgi:hypothetical protein